MARQDGRGSRSTSTGALLLAALVLLTTSACSDGDPGARPADEPEAAAASDPTRVGPAPDVDGALPGGTVTVYLPGDSGPSSLDPTAGASATSAAIQQALVSRSLTQLVRDDDGGSVLVPDLAVDLGTPNDDYTEWTFTLRDDATWEDGSTITPRQVAFGIARSMDTATFPDGPGARWSQTYFAGAGDYRGPYTDDDPDGLGWGGVRVEGQQVVVTMAAPFPDMAWWASSLAIGPVPVGAVSDPATYGTAVRASGPYRVESFEPGRELVLVKNEQWDPNTDPGRHQYVDRWDFRFDADQVATDALMLSDGIESRSTVVLGLGGGGYPEAKATLGARLVVQPTPCATYLVPDQARVPDVDVRRALAAAWPADDVWRAEGEVPGVTRVAPDSDLPPGVPGRRSYLVGDDAPTYDPARSRELLAAAGHTSGDLPLRIAYRAGDPTAAAVQAVVEERMAAAGFAVTGVAVADPATAQADVRQLDLCAAWPSGLTVLPDLLGPGLEEDVQAVTALPLDEQPDAWGELDERVAEESQPVVPTSYTNRLLQFGSGVGHPTGESWSGGPNYRELFLTD